MKLKDISNGPDWIIWIVLAFFVLLTVVFLTGHGAKLIAGYNTSGEEEKSKYDEKKLCRVTGVGMLVVTIFVFAMAVGNNVLPAATAYVFVGVVVIDCIIVSILANTICKK
ncbi:DUF3784 domain-containing protein [Ruminococcaceae bacterium OttesenSCG-928-L11]|nr:DUF3784 domain-containing protein [Ruminococcaceae bacterium OttesenSCG-928-L11]